MHCAFQKVDRSRETYWLHGLGFLVVTIETLFRKNEEEEHALEGLAGAEVGWAGGGRGLARGASW